MTNTLTAEQEALYTVASDFARMAYRAPRECLLGLDRALTIAIEARINAPSLAASDLEMCIRKMWRETATEFPQYADI